MVRKATGASYPAVSDRIIFDSRLPLPSLSEQRRIAAILDQADALRAKRREALAQLDSLTQSIFMEMFEGDRKLPQLDLRDLCELITDGTHYTPTYADEGTIFLSAKNVTSGYVDWVNIKYIPEALHLELQKRVAPRRGDVLLAKNGTTGIAAIVDRECVFDIYVSLALLRPSSEVLSTYLHAAINSPLTKRQFDGALKGIGVPNLHLKDIRLARIPQPTLEAQKTFATRIQAVEALKTQHRAALTELDALFASLQHRAFQGAL
jgi:type I restriction enzyme S subunit